MWTVVSSPQAGSKRQTKVQIPPGFNLVKQWVLLGQGLFTGAEITQWQLLPKIHSSQVTSHERWNPAHCTTCRQLRMSLIQVAHWSQLPGGLASFCFFWVVQMVWTSFRTQLCPLSYSWSGSVSQQSLQLLYAWGGRDWVNLVFQILPESSLLKTLNILTSLKDGMFHFCRKEFPSMWKVSSEISE